MEAEVITLGSSIHVPCVEELAKKSLTTVLLRYFAKVTVRTIHGFGDGKAPLCMQTMGFLSVDKSWSELFTNGRVKMEIEEFFNLPMKEKRKYWQKPGEMEGFGQAFVVSEEQKLDWGDIFYMITLPHNLRKPHLFPKLPTPFRDTFESYSAEMKNLALKVLNLMTKAPRMEPKEMRETFENGCQKVIMNYYPPSPQPELVMGLNSVEGLQIKKDGKWVPVKPLCWKFVLVAAIRLNQCPC